MSSTDPVKIHESTLRLHDGRTLGYTTYGKPTGKTLLYFGSSRLEAGILAQPAELLGIRLVGIDRPGMGWSPFQKGRHLLDWPADVVEVTDHFQLDRFAVVGTSGGGPYALACAYAIPDRLTACGIVSGVGPVRARFYQRLPWLLIPMMWVMGQLFRDEAQARKSIRRFTRSWPESDRQSLLLPEINDWWAASMVEAFRQGARGLTYDTLLGEGRPWGFKLEDITFPRVYLWHGEQDQDVPLSMGRAVASQLPHCQATFYPEEGHLSVIVNHREEIVTTLMAEEQERSIEEWQ